MSAANWLAAEIDPVDDNGFRHTNDFGICLPCEDAAYDNDMFPKNFYIGVDKKLGQTRERDLQLHQIHCASPMLI